MLVVLTHVAQRNLAPESVAALVPVWGREAVMLFFVLSGFVIAYTCEQKSATLSEYCVARCARIYSAALPLLLAAFAGAAIAIYVRGVPVAGDYEVARAFVYIPFHLLFLGELWNLSEVPPWMPQYWSLGYEVWYYVFFACVYYGRGMWRWVLTALVLALMGPKLWLLLPIWLSGVALYHGLKRFTLTPGMARGGWLLSVLLLVLLHASGLEETGRQFVGTWWPFSGIQLGSAVRFQTDYLVCLLVLANFACARYAAFGGLLRLAKPIRALAAYTFTLYLVHEMVINCWRTFHGHDANSASDVLVLASLVIGGTWLVGQVTEHRKHWFHHAFDRLFRHGAGLHVRLRA